MGKPECGTGAPIERGKIAEVLTGGYKVDNLDRTGLTSREITGIDNTAYTVGDIVYFFMFRDGTGKIICKA